MRDTKAYDAKARLQRVGFDPGDAWRATERTIATVRAMTKPEAIKDALSAAVAAGDVDAAARLAVESAANVSRTAEALELAESAALRTVYPWKDAYRFACDRYNDAAALLMEAAKRVDIDADAAEVMDQREDRRNAWKAAPGLAADVESAYRDLLAVAQVTITTFFANQTPYSFALAVGTWENATVRRALEIWEARTPKPGTTAWTNSEREPVRLGRCGRFGELAKMGKLSAPTLDAFTPLVVPELVRAFDGAIIDPLIDPGRAAAAEQRNRERDSKLTRGDAAARMMR